MCFIPRRVYIIRINKDTIRQYTTLYYNKSKQLHVSAVQRQPSSDRMFQKRKKGNYTVVAIHCIEYIYIYIYNIIIYYHYVYRVLYIIT